jgi:hypothetical protein
MKQYTNLVCREIAADLTRSYLGGGVRRSLQRMRFAQLGAVQTDALLLGRLVSDNLTILLNSRIIS